MMKKEDLSKAIIDLKYNEISHIIENALNTGLKPLVILDELKDGARAPGGGFIYGTSNIAEYDIPIENIIAFYDTCKKIWKIPN